MPRIDIKDISEEDIKNIDNQVAKYGFTGRVAYTKYLLKLDILTDVVEIIKERRKNNEE